MTDPETQPLLAISNLTVRHPSGPAILSGLNLTLSRGEAVGILGASGCGKTTLARAIPGLLPPRCAVTGVIEFAGHDVLRMNANALRKLRGAHIASLFQEPSLSLSPHLHAGAQIAEVMAAHRGLRNGELTSAVLEMLDPLFGDESPRIALAYPHELSGGERQRVAIARALCCAPELLIADEPTASLDAIGQRELFAVLDGYREQTGMSMILAGHNRAGLRKHTDRCLELRDGRLEPV